MMDKNNEGDGVMSKENSLRGIIEYLSDLLESGDHEIIEAHLELNRKVCKCGFSTDEVLTNDIHVTTRNKSKGGR